MSFKCRSHIYLYGRALCDYSSRPRVPAFDYEKYMDIKDLIKRAGYLDLPICATCETYFMDMYRGYSVKCEEGACTQYSLMMARVSNLGWI